MTGEALARGGLSNCVLRWLATAGVTAGRNGYKGGTGFEDEATADSTVRRQGIQIKNGSCVTGRRLTRVLAVLLLQLRCRASPTGGGANRNGLPPGALASCR